MFKILDSKDGQFYAVVTADNGKELHRSSEMHTQKHNVKKELLAAAAQYSPAGGAMVVWDMTKSRRTKWFILGWGKNRLKHKVRMQNKLYKEAKPAKK